MLTLSLFSGFAAAETDKNYEFIFVCPIVGLEYWNLCADGIAAADAEFGTSTQIVGPTDSSNFVTEVVTYMESAIATQPDGIFCYAGLESMPRLLQEAADAGIPVGGRSTPTARIPPTASPMPAPIPITPVTPAARP